MNLGLHSGVIYQGLNYGLNSGVVLNGICQGQFSNEAKGNDGTAFISVWNTRLVGSSTFKQVRLPFHTVGTYNYTVDWGDGIKENIRTAIQPLHTYTTAGVYTIKITGKMNSFDTTAANDIAKCIQIIQWGSFVPSNVAAANGAFNNSKIDFTQLKDIPLNSNKINLSVNNKFNSLFYQNTSMTYVNRLNEWDITNVNDINSIFSGCTNFNQNIGNLNVSSVLNMSGAFSNAAKFNNGESDSINTWNVSSVLNMSNMFAGATDFNQNIGDWNVSNCTSFNGFMAGKTPATFSIENFDSLLNGWSSRPVQPNMNIDFGTANYSISGGSAGYNILIASGWTITSGGAV